jgi:TonB family protein
MNWFRKAEEQGNADAQNNIGWIYQNGLGVPQDKSEAINWYRKAAGQGNARALNNLIGLSQTPHAAGTIVQVCSKGNTADCVTPPRAVFAPDPEFSKEARDAKYQGKCVLMVTVGTDGLLTNIRVVKSLGKGLDEKAVEAVQKWKFEPGMKDGQPVAVELAVEVDFRLK